MRFLICAIFSLSLAQAGETEISRSRFLAAFKAGTPDTFCAEKTYFRKCFDTSPENCRKVMASALAGCVAALEATMPATLKQPKDGQDWGKKIGACTGEKFELKLVKSKRPDPECRDASKWQ